MWAGVLQTSESMICPHNSLIPSQWVLHCPRTAWRRANSSVSSPVWPKWSDISQKIGHCFYRQFPSVVWRFQVGVKLSSRCSGIRFHWDIISQKRYSVSFWISWTHRENIQEKTKRLFYGEGSMKQRKIFARDRILSWIRPVKFWQGGSKL